MATNLPEKLDPAMLRPGRIDRIYKVGYPSKAGRIRTYEGYLAKVEHNLSPRRSTASPRSRPYATGATIKDLVNEALINAIRESRDVVTWGDIVKAKQLKDLGPPEDVEYIERERHATALHEACHAVVAYRVRHHLVIDIATIEKGGNYLGMVSSIPPEDLFTRWRSDYESDVMVSLASLAGEKMFFAGDSSSGVSGDLESATQLATFMEGYWGMGQTISSHGVTHRVGVGRRRSAGQAGRGEGSRAAEGGARRPHRGEAPGALRAHRAARPRQPGPGARGDARAREPQDAHRRGHRGGHQGRAGAARRRPRVRRRPSSRGSPRRTTPRSSTRTGATGRSRCPSRSSTATAATSARSAARPPTGRRATAAATAPTTVTGSPPRSAIPPVDRRR